MGAELRLITALTAIPAGILTMGIGFIHKYPGFSRPNRLCRKGQLQLITLRFLNLQTLARATVASSILGKKIVAKNSPFWVTGIGQFAGGMILVLSAFILGADMLTFRIRSTVVFIYICTASTVAYVLWNYIIRTANLSKMFIIKFAEPMFACIFGAIILGEDIFKIQYLVAFVLISLGIILGNRSEKG